MPGSRWGSKSNYTEVQISNYTAVKSRLPLSGKHNLIMMTSFSDDVGAKNGLLIEFYIGHRLVTLFRQFIVILEGNASMVGRK